MLNHPEESTMKGCNDITEDRFTKEELDQFAQLGLSKGDRVLHRGEGCTVTALSPLRFSMDSDQYCSTWNLRGING